MLENTWYSVISPEGCASILWRDAAKAPEAADAMKVTPEDLFEMEICDEIINEPLGGAHREFEQTAFSLKSSVFYIRFALLTFAVVYIAKDLIYL